MTIPIFTRLLTQGEFGEFNNFLSWLNLLAILSSIQLGATLIRARFELEDKINDYIKSILLLGTLCTAVVFLITRIDVAFFTKLFSMPDEYIIYMFAYLAVAPALDYFQTMQSYHFKYKISVAISLFSTVATVGVSLLLMLLMRNKLTGRLIGAYAPLIALSLVFYIYYMVKGGKPKISYWKYALPVCLPFVPHALAMTVLNSTDRIMITNFCGSEATALYSLAYTCSMVITILWTSFNNAFSPWLGEKLNLKDYDSIYKISVKYVLVFAIPVVGILLISPELVLIMGGQSYMESMYVMPPVMLGCFFQFLYSMYVNIEQFERKTVGMAIASLCAAGLNVGLNFIFIPMYGYVAAAYTTLAGYLFLFGAHFFLVKRMKLTKVYHTKRILELAGVMILIGVVVNFIYPYNIVRYILFGIYLVIFVILLYKKRDMIKRLIKRS